MNRKLQYNSFMVRNFTMVCLALGLSGLNVSGSNKGNRVVFNDSAKISIAQTIVKEDLEKHLKVISSDAYEGRETGQKGQKLAAKYLANCFSSYNIPPLKPQPGIVDGYFHQYKLVKKDPLGIGIKAGEKSYLAFEDYYYNPRRIQDVNASYNQVHFLGYGINDAAYNDYGEVDIKENGIGIILSGEPMNKQGQHLISGNQNPSIKSEDATKIAEAKKQGLGCLLIAVPDLKQRIARYKHHFLKPSLTLMEDNEDDNTFNCFYISYEMADEFLGFTNLKSPLSKLENKIRKQKEPYSKLLNLSDKIEVSSTRKHETVISENVLGFIEGKDKKDEVIILTAHYDHLGKRDSIIYNGADDDGSGTVALLELAEAFSIARDLGYGPRRSILFMPVSAEEKGLLGSRYYTENPIFPLENTIANLNIDMIGRIDTNYKSDPNYLYVIGADRLSMDLHDINKTANDAYTQIKLDYRFNEEDDPNRFYYRSDHYNFAKNNIPSVFYFTGVHEDYHKPTDTIDKIHFGKMERIIRLIYYTTWELANRDERIKLNKTNN